MVRILWSAAMLMALFIGDSGYSAAETRKPAVAGMFYPGDSTELRAMVRQHLDRAEIPSRRSGRLLALIVPHAGLLYSGQIAAHAYKLLQDDPPTRVVLVGPSHRFRFNGLSVYGPGVTWETPLGVISCDDDLCRMALHASNAAAVVKSAHLQEHCLEVQLPYLQTVAPDCRIMPIVFGTQDVNTIHELTDILIKAAGDEKALLIASTDWQHYRPAEVGQRMDSLGMDCLTSLDPDRLAAMLRESKVEACGGPAAAAVLKASIALGADRVEILRYGDSGDITGDKSSVVGYVAAAIYADTSGTDETTGLEDAKTMQKTTVYTLSAEDRALLLKIAREAVVSHLTECDLPATTVPDRLKEPGAAFVTLESHGQLRGCIGYTTASAPLDQTVADCAIKAATEDPRFPPVTADEISSLSVEISYLTPMQRVRQFDEIEVGRDGLMIDAGYHRGLLLPQVASEYGWDRTAFLQHTCLKAGLPPDAYLSPEAVIYRFQAEVFGEQTAP